MSDNNQDKDEVNEAFGVMQASFEQYKDKVQELEDVANEYEQIAARQFATIERLSSERRVLKQLLFNDVGGMREGLTPDIVDTVKGLLA